MSCICHLATAILIPHRKHKYSWAPVRTPLGLRSKVARQNFWHFPGMHSACACHKIRKCATSSRYYAKWNSPNKSSINHRKIPPVQLILPQNFQDSFASDESQEFRINSGRWSIAPKFPIVGPSECTGVTSRIGRWRHGAMSGASRRPRRPGRRRRIDTGVYTLTHIAFHLNVGKSSWNMFLWPHLRVPGTSTVALLHAGSTFDATMTPK